MVVVQLTLICCGLDQDGADRVTSSRVDGGTKAVGGASNRTPESVKPDRSPARNRASESGGGSSSSSSSSSSNNTANNPMTTPVKVPTYGKGSTKAIIK